MKGTAMADDEQGAEEKIDTYEWILGEDLTIYAIEGLKQQIAEQLDIFQGFEINLAAVEEIDSAGIQLLLALRSELFRRDKPFKISAVSVVVAKLISSYGLNERFSLEPSQ